MNLFKEMAKFIGWLSGSLAGLGAVLYAFGYLLTRAHLNLLGVSLNYGSEQYMQEGAKFIIVFADLVGRIFLPLLISLGALAVATGLPIGIALLACRYPPVKRRMEKLRAKASGSWARIQAQRPWLWRVLVFSGLLLLLFLALERDLNLFSTPLSLSDLLYRQHELQSTETGDRALLRSWILAGSQESLDNYFFGLVLAFLKVVLLLLAAVPVALAWRLRTLLLMPFAIVFMIYLILLPMNYGVLMRPAKFARVTLATSSELLGGKTAELYLLDRNEREFVLWDPARSRVLWIPTGEIKGAEIRQMEFLFPGRK